MKDKFYQFKVVNEEMTDLLIYGDVTNYGWQDNDVNAYQFAKELKEVTTEKLNVHINSYGGSVAQGLAIYNLLKSFNGEVTTICDGFACSIASVIFMAGTNRIMNTGSMLMIHNAWSSMRGNANEFRKQAETLEKISSSSVDIYSTASNLTRKEIIEKMDAETWITADEAVEWGFATSKKEEEVNQSLEPQFLMKQILLNKALKNELEKTKEKLEKHDDPSGWNAFFNTK